jgi:hypothetical protein
MGETLGTVESGVTSGARAVSSSVSMLQSDNVLLIGQGGLSGIEETLGTFNSGVTSSTRALSSIVSMLQSDNVITIG